MPDEIRQIGSSVLSACQAIDDVRSRKTHFHGKIDGDYVIEDPELAYFIVNIVSSIGLFLQNVHDKNLKNKMDQVDEGDENPF